MNVTLEEAYAEACRALGESIVTQRLLSAELEKLTSQKPQQPDHKISESKRT
jgi:hypothetical protein